MGLMAGGIITPPPLYVVQTIVTYASGAVVPHAYGPCLEPAATKYRREFLAMPLTGTQVSKVCNANLIQPVAKLGVPL